MDNTDQKQYVYSCDKCEFYTNAKSMWDKHIISGKHQNGIRAVRCDKKLPTKCPHCDFIPKTSITARQHLLNIHSTKEDRKKQFKYYCDNCDFGTFAEQIYNTHLKTEKHLHMQEIINKLESKK